MSETQYNKESLIRLIMVGLDSVSSDKESAKSYLSEHGLDANEVISEGLQRIRKVKLQIEASKTKNEMLSNESLRRRAIEKAKELLGNTEFSFAAFVKANKLAIQNRNIESFTKEDIENTLNQYFYLKYLEERQDKDSSSDNG